MIKSKYFWIGAILLAIIPLLMLDIPNHYIDWRRDVHDERVYVTQNTYAYTPQQKTQILEQISASNKSLLTLMCIKGFSSILLFGLCIYFFRKYCIIQKDSKRKAVLTCAVLLVLIITAKLYSWTSFAGDEKIMLLTQSVADTTLTNIYNANFKGKVVYVDFWGTTCAPCLEEFKNFTKPLKDQYQNRPDIAYLYICGGTKLIWKQQLQKFNIEGDHIFLNTKDYAALFHRSVRGSKDSVLAMPRYLIMDKHGKIVDKDAPPPSERDSISAHLNKYLTVQ
jgi:thiol-disulfide isomerase/thioredoxin